jgi:ADP-ribosylglycohydrolase
VDRVAGGLLGLHAGDSLGLPLRFLTAAGIWRKHGFLLQGQPPGVAVAIAERCRGASSFGLSRAVTAAIRRGRVGDWTLPREPGGMGWVCDSLQTGSGGVGQ